MRRYAWLFACAFFFAAAPMALPLGALAQDGEAADTAEAEDPATSRATSFRAVTGPDAEDVPGGTLLIVAYALIWLFVLVFVLRLGKLNASTLVEVARLRQALDASGSETPKRDGAD